jgi:TolB protein
MRTHDTPARRHFLGALSLVAMPSWAQFRVEVSGVGQVQMPIAIAGFKGDDQSPQRIAAIVRDDLERSGQFRSVDASSANGLDESSRPDFSSFRQKAADSLLTGSATRLADGRYDVRFRLWDVVKGSRTLGRGKGYAHRCFGIAF